MIYVSKQKHLDVKQEELLQEKNLKQHLQKIQNKAGDEDRKQRKWGGKGKNEEEVIK